MKVDQIRLDMAWLMLMTIFLELNKIKKKNRKHSGGNNNENDEQSDDTIKM